MRAPVTHPGGRTGLVGTVLCIGALAVVAHIAAPDPTQAAQISSGDRLAGAVTSVRSVVGAYRLHAGTRTAPNGWPMGINPEWFPGGELPIHPDTGQPFTIEAIDGRIDECLPTKLTFGIDEPGARTLWYNRTNGCVAARVVDDGDRRSSLARFSRANGVDLRD